MLNLCVVSVYEARTMAQCFRMGGHVSHYSGGSRPSPKGGGGGGALLKA